MVPQTLKGYGTIDSEENLACLSASAQQDQSGEYVDYPRISGALGVSAAIMAAATSEWGRAKPRTEREIEDAFRVNALYFTQNSVSGTLNYLTKQGRLRRVPQDGKYAYTPTAEALVTA
jgi:hypothetical protein